MDGFFGIGIQELVLIAIVALIVLGPERLPAALRGIAKFIRQVRNLTNEFTAQFGDDFKALEDLDPRRILQRELASIDEEEQAKENTGKPKATPAKTTSTTPPKPTPAKATTPKTTTTNKSSTAAQSTTTASTTTTTPATTASSSASTPAPATDTPTVADPATPQPTNTDAQSTNNAETANQIVPPALAATKQEVNEGSPAAETVVVPPVASTNGVPPQASEITAASDVVATAPVTTNGAQDQLMTQSE